MSSPHEQYYDEDRRRWPEYPFEYEGDAFEPAEEEEDLE